MLYFIFILFVNFCNFSFIVIIIVVVVVVFFVIVFVVGCDDSDFGDRVRDWYFVGGDVVILDEIEILECSFMCICID